MSESSTTAAVSAPLPSVQPEYFRRPEAATFCGLKLSQFDKLLRTTKKAGRPLPPKIRVHRKLTLFPRIGLIEWLNQHQVAGDPLPRPKRRRGRPRKAVAR